ncbi:Slit 3 Protein [Manis pentadactyla]|nr:Slit 3 Protein [Manis pentadactyla]
MYYWSFKNILIFSCEELGFVWGGTLFLTAIAGLLRISGSQDIRWFYLEQIICTEEESVTHTEEELILSCAESATLRTWAELEILTLNTGNTEPV